ncbi:MAG: YpdA family putative bacillithiol disulfide reductase [Rhodothermia bacterium]|nr:YpdA family putative bacillithiol disulfide reductase [Rhodothermia bacterium]
MTSPGSVYVVVVGAGPVGLACAIECRRRDLSVRLFDKGAIVNSLLGYPTNMEFFSTPDLLEIGGYPFPTLGYKPVREEAIDYYRRVAFAENIEMFLFNAVTGIDGEEGSYEVRSEGEVTEAANVIVATGFFDYPRLLGVDGEDLPKVMHYYKEPYAYAGQEVAVIGAKNSAAKAALECFRHGAQVTMIVRGPEIGPSVKYWIRPDVENRIREGSIRAMFNTEVVQIEPKTIVVRNESGVTSLQNDWVLAMTGYRPDYGFLETAGIGIGDDPDRTPIHDPRTFETSRRGVFLAGTVCGGLNTSRWFIENGREHAAVIAETIAGRRIK